MAAEALIWLLRAGLALGVAIAVLMALRPLWRRALGAPSVLWLWWLLPAVLLAMLLPRPVQVIEVSMHEAAAAAPVMASSAAPRTAVAGNMETLAALAWLGWGLGAGALALGLVRRQRRFISALGELRPRGDGSYLAQGAGFGPVVVGALRPRIVLPADFAERYDDEQQALVLAHEACHRRRGDLQAQLALCALRCLFWFNPLVHLLPARLRLDQELACDALVLARFPDARRAYANALVNTQLADLGLPVGCHWQSSHPLKWRITMLKHPSPGTARRILGAGLALLAGTATASVAWQAQPADQVAVPAIPVPARATTPLPALAVATPAALPAPTPLAQPADAPAPRPALRPAPAPRFVTTPETLPPPPTPEPRALPAPAPVATPAAVPVADAGFSPPQVLRHRAARLPVLDPAGVAHRGGFVVVRVDLDSDGEPQSVAVQENALDPVYGRNAVAAARRWEFSPARQDGLAVASTVLVPVVFAAREDRAERLRADAMWHPRPRFAPAPQLVAVH